MGPLALPIPFGNLRGARWIPGSALRRCSLGLYERRKVGVFSASLQPGHVVYDVGAHVGFYTLLAARRVGGSGRVYAFEPLPRNLEYLKEHLQMNRVANVTVVAAAVAEREGMMRFQPSETGLDRGDSFMGKLSDGGVLETPVVTLDRVAGPPPDVVKIDVEGAEMRVLEGGRGLLATKRPTVFVATHGRDEYERCQAFLTSLGYRVSKLSGKPTKQWFVELRADPLPIDARRPVAGLR